MNSSTVFRIAMLAALWPTRTPAQEPERLLQQPTVRSAIAAVKGNEPHFIEEQIRICEIPAPPFHEEARARELVRLFRKLGLHDVRMDRAGNVIGMRPGAAAHPNVVLAAHIDTVFPEGTDVTVKRAGTVLKAPGIGDDCRGLVVVLGVIQALNDGDVQTPGAITFVADTGEEGLGDLRGAKNLFNESLKGQIDKFVSVDGTGFDITNAGVGSYRYKVTFKGPGGHSFESFGNANPIQAMGRAIAKIDHFEVPSEPKTTFNVGRVGGGTSVNSIPFEAWMEVDLRSADTKALDLLRSKLESAVKEAVEEENARWNNYGPVTFSLDSIGLRPAGKTREDSAVVQTALAVSRALGLESKLNASSTDSNIPMHLGVPALTIGGGGKGSGAHSLNETFDTKDSWRGTERALLLVIALAR